jgi:hypothetical protein
VTLQAAHFCLLFAGLFSWANKWFIRDRAYPSFCSIKWLGALLPLGMLVHRRLPPQLLLVPIYTPGLREASIVKCLAQGHREKWNVTCQDSNRGSPTPRSSTLPLHHYSPLFSTVKLPNFQSKP